MESKNIIDIDNEKLNSFLSKINDSSILNQVTDNEKSSICNLSNEIKFFKIVENY